MNAGAGGSVVEGASRERLVALLCALSDLAATSRDLPSAATQTLGALSASFGVEAGEVTLMTAGQRERIAGFGTQHEPLLSAPVIADGLAVGALVVCGVSRTPVFDAAVSHAAQQLGRVVERARHEAGRERFRAVYEEVGVGIALADMGGTLVSANPAFASFLGYTVEELGGRDLRELIHPDDRAATVREWNELRSGSRSAYDSERRYLTKTGDVVWGRVTAGALSHSGLIVGVVQNIDSRKRAEEQVQRLSGRLLQIQDEERRRTARTLHESAAQTLAALSMNLQRMERMSLGPDAAEALNDSLELATQCLSELRTLSHLLHPPLLDEAGLPSTLRWYVAAFSSRSAIDVELSVDESLGRLPKDHETALFRVVQESLTNIHRHAGSDHARVQLERRGDEVTLEVSDRGIGIAPAALAQLQAVPAALGVGIAGMRERVVQLGGDFQLDSGKDGTRVRVVLRSGR